MKDYGKLKTIKNNKSIFITALAVILAVMTLFSAFAASAAADDNGETNEKKVFDPFFEDTDYSFALYNNTNGLPTSEANTITQTSDGFIWIGSYGGLVRYDGNNFERMDSSLGISGIVSLFADKEDRLWLGSNDSGLAMLSHDGLSKWGFEDGLKSLAINCIIEDPKGIIYVGTKDGLYYLDKSLELALLPDDRVTSSNIIDMKLGSDGMVYCLSNEKDLFTVWNTQIEKYYPGDTIPTPGIRCMLPDKKRPGYVYFGADDGVYQCDMNSAPRIVNTYTHEALKLPESLTYINDRVWTCASDNVLSLFGSEARVLEGIPMNNKVNYIMQDYEGNLWLTSTRQGVLKITPNQFSNLYLTYDIPSAVVNSTRVYDNKLFIATDTGLTVIDNGKTLDTLPLDNSVNINGTEYTDLIDMLKEERIRSLIEDSTGKLWISTWRGAGLVCYEHGRAISYNTHNGFISDSVRTICELKDGSIAVATNNGVCVIKDGEIQKSYGKDEGLENTVILTVAQSESGELLAGSDGGGIYVIGDNGTKDTLRINDGLTSDTILRLKHDHKRDLIWIITSNSIGYITPDLKITTINNFPYTNNFDFVQNSKDEMWVLSSNGIYVLQTEEMLADAADLDPAHYTTSNGLACTATANSFSGLTDDGDFYISGNTGVVKVNIEKEFDGAMDYKASVPYIHADDDLMFPDENGNYTIPSSTKTLTINAFVFNYSLMTPQVSYCLDGFSNKYTTVDSDELVPLYYTNLRGGTYRFVMKVTDQRTKEEKIITVKIVKQKAFYEKIWFIILSAALVILIILFTLRAFYKSKIAKMQMKHKEEVEKERITTELNTAGKIQEGMLPSEFPPFPDRREFDLYASMDPAKTVGGDFYDFFLVDDDHLCMVIADVSGKGVPAALVMMATMIVIRNYAELGKSPCEIMTLANDQICHSNKQDMFITVWLGILEISTGKLTASNAGHEYPALMKPNGKFELYMDKHGIVVGGIEGVKYREYELDLEPGSKLFLYTDGVPEASDKNEELFGTDRMIAALNTANDLPPEQILKKVRGAVDEFVQEAEQFDDLTMLCLEYKGKQNGESDTSKEITTK